MPKPLAPVYGDCYARWYSSELRVHYNADMDEIPEESGAAGKPEEEGRRLHDLFKRKGAIDEAEASQIAKEEHARKMSQRNSEREAAIKRDCHLVSEALRAAGVSQAEINRRCEVIRAKASGEEAPENTGPEESGGGEAGNVDTDREIGSANDSNLKPRPDDALGALIWDVEQSKSTGEKEQVLRAAHHQTLSNLVIKIDLEPAIGDGSKDKNVAMVLAKLEAEG